MYPPKHQPDDYANTLRQVSRELRARAARAAPANSPPDYVRHADVLDSIAFDLMLIDAEQPDA